MNAQFHMKIIFIFLLLTGIASASATGNKPVVKQETEIQKKYSVLLYANNTIYRMNPDGTARTKIAEKAGILDLFPLSDERILVHSSQYEGESLEICDPVNNIWSLVEFTEGKMPLIAVSENGIKVAYEIKHFPISINGDGIWLYDTTGKKIHIKISNTALTIESFTIFSGKLYTLYHELDLVSDEAGLFLEAIWLEGGSGKPVKKRVAEGLKMLLPDGFSLGLAYPPAGRRIELKPIPDGKAMSADIPKCDIILHEGGYSGGKDPVLIFDRKSVDFSGEGFTETLAWKINTGKIDTLVFKDLANTGGFRWASDGWLYFTASYKDPSGELSLPMLFRANNPGGAIELVSVLGGLFTLQYE